MSKNIIFAGTPEFAAYHLQSLIDSGIVPTLVLTQPDRKAGRGRKLTPTPVKQVAIANNIEVFQPIKLDNEAKEKLTKLPTPDLLIVVAYGLLLPQWTLDLAKFGAINVHASLLPRWRGAAPIQRAIEAGDSKSGVSIMQMELGLDTGPVWCKAEISITDTTNAEMLLNKMKNMGSKLLIEVLPTIFLGKKSLVKQDGSKATYAKKLTKQEAKINWEEDAETICRKIRAFNPVPVAHTETETDKFRIFAAKPTNILENSKSKSGKVIAEDKTGITVKCKDGTILITEIQEIGKKRLKASQYINGKSLLGVIFKS